MDSNIVNMWLKTSSGYGYGAGSGDSYGDGDGSGYGSGYGSGDGYGYGNGDGDGSGYGYSNGSGYGSGSGSSSGSSSGSGSSCGFSYGSGSGYKINNDYIHDIDNLPTIIKSIKGQIAKGYIVNDDLSMTKTFVVKSLDNNYFTHGKSIKKAFESLEEKIIADLDVEERIDLFLSELDTDKKYEFKYFFGWHGKLTGSCLQGREVFCKNKGLEMEQKMDIHEFLDICRGEYGWSVMCQVKERIK